MRNCINAEEGYCFDNVVMAPNLNSFKSRLNVHYKNFPMKFCPSFMSAR